MQSDQNGTLMCASHFSSGPLQLGRQSEYCIRGVCVCVCARRGVRNCVHAHARMCAHCTHK